MIYRANARAITRQSRAKLLLTPEEQAEYVWRCPVCGRHNFKSASGYASHKRTCTKEENG